MIDNLLRGAVLVGLPAPVCDVVVVLGNPVDETGLSSKA